MQADLHSVSKIFSETLFRIPDYQRGYSWTKKHLKDFLTDLEQIEEGRNHYTGVITLEDVPKETYCRWEDDLWIIQSRHYRPYYVVDGQQRLTTIIVFIQSILEIFEHEKSLNYTPISDIRKKFIFDSKDEGISRSYIFGYEKDNPSYEFLKTKIFLEQSDRHSTYEETIYTHNLGDAKDFFLEKLKPLTLPEIESLYTKVTQHLLFNIYTISEDIDVFVAFETMNNRGKPLSHLELLKNRLIFLSTKFQVDSEEKAKLRATINESWKTVYHYLGKNKDRALDDDSFLITHFFLRFGAELFISDNEGNCEGIWQYKHGDNYQDYLLNTKFTVKRISNSNENPCLSLLEIYEYARDIKKVVEIFYYIFNPKYSNFTDTEKITLERLRRLAQSRNRFGLSGSLVLIVSFFLKENDHQKIEHILDIIEQIEFIDSISHYISGVEAIDFTEEAIKYINNNINLKQLTSRLERHLSNILLKIKFNQVFSEWGKNRGYYGWKGVKYFLFEYELSLKSNSKTSREKLIWNDFIQEDYSSDFYSIEHIYPQKVTDEYWKSSFKNYTVQERNILKNSIGNLVPLSKPKNSSLGKKCFNEKKGNKSNKVGYHYGCYAENEIAQEDQWTAHEILFRGIKLLEFMETRWKIPIGDKKAKIKALSLDFVLSKEKITL